MKPLSRDYLWESGEEPDLKDSFEKSHKIMLNKLSELDEIKKEIENMLSTTDKDILGLYGRYYSLVRESYPKLRGVA